MSHLVIDGYNLIRQIPALARYEAQSMEAGRNNLIRMLAAYRKFKQHKISVVFDGALNMSEFAPSFQQAGISVHFSPESKTADDIIMEMIRQDPQRIMVVSSDRELIRCAEANRCDWVSAKEFYDKLKLAAVMDEGFTDKDSPEKNSRSQHKRWTTHKKGPSKRAPKKERRKLGRMKSL